MLHAAGRLLPFELGRQQLGHAASSAPPIRLAVRPSTIRNQPITVSMYLRVWYQSDDAGMRI